MFFRYSRNAEWEKPQRNIKVNLHKRAVDEATNIEHAHQKVRAIG